MTALPANKPFRLSRRSQITSVVRVPVTVSPNASSNGGKRFVRHGRTCSGAPMDEGLRFAIREGGRTVGAGRVTKIIK